MPSKPFRHAAGFGKRIEYYVVSLMLKEGLDVFLPMIDDDAIDAVVKKPDGKYVEIQIKARSKDVAFGDAALFAAIEHEYRENYWFVFYSERIDNTILIMSSKEFIKEAAQNKKGKNVGKRSIWFNGKNTKEKKEHIKTQFKKYVVNDFSRILNEDPNKT
jgi:superfamily II DNA/RNA helicase